MSEPTSRRRLGVPAVTFMIVAASAPLTVLAGGVTTTFAVTGVLGVPLSMRARAPPGAGPCEAKHDETMTMDTQRIYYCYFQSTRASQDAADRHTLYV